MHGQGSCSLQAFTVFFTKVKACLPMVLCCWLAPSGGHTSQASRTFLLMLLASVPLVPFRLGSAVGAH